MSAPENLRIVLVHAFNKERKEVPVENITQAAVFVRWGQSGLYELNLKTNALTACSVAARRKGQALWSAEDIESVRRAAKTHLDGIDKGKQTEMRMAVHAATMPNSADRYAKVMERAKAFNDFSAPLEKFVDEVLSKPVASPMPALDGDDDA